MYYLRRLGENFSWSSAAIAQLVEHLIRNERVTCSSHVGGFEFDIGFMDKNLLKEFIDATVLDQDKAAAMLKQNGALLNARYIHNETVLHFLCVEDYIEGVKSLLENGAEVDATNEFGDVALLDAVSIGRTEIVKLLLQFGADANAVSATRGHVLHLAAETGNHEIFEALLQHGARTDYVDDLGKSLADCITQKQSKRAKIIKVLEKHQASR